MSDTEKQIPFKTGDIIHKEEYGSMYSYEVLKVDIKQMKIRGLDRSFTYTQTIRGSDIFSFSATKKEAYQKYKKTLEVKLSNLDHHIEETKKKIKSIDKLIEKES